MIPHGTHTDPNGRIRESWCTASQLIDDPLVLTTIKQDRRTHDH